MLWKGPAAVGAGVVLAMGLGVTAPNAVQHNEFRSEYAPGSCLDCWAGFGPSSTTCNEGACRHWLWTPGIPATGMRQDATGLCVTVRNDVATRKPCAVTDAAALGKLSPARPNPAEPRVLITDATGSTPRSPASPPP
ncbi:hypothetical protein [Amycolatopsis sp. NPDC051903]|uniref:hypothetical protein n=1 Tax=Amycolatopsis sp. NPDC051903 TaxID=3363936 RepID=UPI0037AF8752